MLRRLLILLAVVCGGCAWPEKVSVREVYNPFPQLHKIAVVPFFNHSDDPTVDGDRFAQAYYHELQQIPGFQVVPVEVAKEAIRQHRLPLSSSAEFRHLARLLKVDAVVAGSITEFSPYYPPRLGLAIAWHAAEPGFAAIPPGYGLDWQGHGDCEAPLDRRTRFEAEFALTREQMQPPGRAGMPAPLHPLQTAQSIEELPPPVEEEAPPPPVLLSPHAGFPEEIVRPAPTFPPGWPEPGSAAPPPPLPLPGPSLPQEEPILTHVRNYNGHDPAFIAALEEFYASRRDARFGGWQAYLQRTDDFVSFCCRLHLHEMLGSRGGSVKTGVLWKWPACR